MSIQFECENCQKKLKVPQSAAGKRGRCNQCGHLNTIPTVASAETITDSSAANDEGAPVAKPIGSGSGKETYNVKSAVNGAVFGPADSATLKGWLDEGRITPNCQLQQTGTQGWTMASAMFPALGAAAPASSDDAFSQFQQTSKTQTKPSELNPYAPTAQLSGPLVGREIVPTTGDIGFCISHGWKVWTQNFGLLLAVSATVFGISMVFNFLQQGMTIGLEAGGDPMLLGIGLIAVGLFSFVLQGWLLLGFLKVCCKLCRGERAEYGMVFSCGKKVPAYLLVMLAVMIPFMVIIGLIVAITMFAIEGGNPAAGLAFVLVIPAILILTLLIWPVYFVLADTELGFGSLSKAIAIGKKNWLVSFPIGFVASLVGGMGMIACGIGMIATIPAAYTIMSTAYLNMSGQLRPR